jgi:16S rRNA (cytosine967-C5)-methyltransferase
MSEIEKANDRRLATQVAGSGRISALLLTLWQRTRLDWGFVTDRLSTTFRHERWLGAQERRFVAETLYGMVRHARRIDFALAQSSRRGASARDHDRMIAYLVLTGAIDLDAARRAAPAIEWTKVAAIDDVIARERSATARLAIGCSLPDWLAARLIADWGDDATAIARALNERAPMTVRANRLKGTRDEAVAALAAEQIETHAGAWAADALVLDTRTNLFGTKAFKAGLVEAQDEGSQLLAELVDPYGTVVDLCAGAGGKTLAMAAMMQSRGRIVAADVDARKLEELRKRARRAGVSNTRAVAITPDGDWPAGLAELVGKCERVLVDAPCSGTGALRRNPEARWRLREEDVQACTIDQRTIAARALELLAPGGRVVYATCSILRAENAAIAEALVRPGFTLVPVVELWPERAALASADGRFLELRPDKHGTDGFFAAVLQRSR